jgi:hypothetical protein
MNSRSMLVTAGLGLVVPCVLGALSCNAILGIEEATLAACPVGQDCTTAAPAASPPPSTTEMSGDAPALEVSAPEATEVHEELLPLADAGVLGLEAADASSAPGPTAPGAAVPGPPPAPPASTPPPQGTPPPRAVCEPTERRCSGSALEQCRADGSGFDPVTNCGTPQLCNQGAGRCNACVPGARRCQDATTVAVCDAAGLTEQASACDVLEACSEGACGVLGLPL